MGANWLRRPKKDAASERFATVPLLDGELVATLHGVFGKPGSEGMVELVAKYRESADQQMAAIDEGLSGGDPYRVERAAHSIKGASASLGAMRAAEIALAIEHSAREGSLVEAKALAALLPPVVDETIGALSA